MTNSDFLSIFVLNLQTGLQNERCHQESCWRTWPMGCNKSAQVTQLLSQQVKYHHSRSGVAGSSFEDVGGSNYWANWMRAREEVDEHFDQRMDFAIAAGHYCSSQDMTNYFFPRAAAVLGKKKSSFAIKQWNFYCKCIVHKNPSVANIHAANTNTNTSTITNTKQKNKYK